MNYELLKKVIEDSGRKLESIASVIGIDRVTLYNKINGLTEFKVSEINSFCDTLHLDAKTKMLIFFNDKLN